MCHCQTIAGDVYKKKSIPFSALSVSSLLSWRHAHRHWESGETVWDLASFKPPQAEKPGKHFDLFTLRLWKWRIFKKILIQSLLGTYCLVTVICQVLFSKSFFKGKLHIKAACLYYLLISLNKDMPPFLSPEFMCPTNNSPQLHETQWPARITVFCYYSLPQTRTFFSRPRTTESLVFSKYLNFNHSGKFDLLHFLQLIYAAMPHCRNLAK